jgi:hypothetical protein
MADGYVVDWHLFVVCRGVYIVYKRAKNYKQNKTLQASSEHHVRAV